MEKKKETCENHEECMKMIQAVLDGSASADEIKRLEANIDICSPCIEGHNLEKSIKDALKNKIEKKCCPEKTISTIKEKIGLENLALIVFLALVLF